MIFLREFFQIFSQNFFTSLKKSSRNKFGHFFRGLLLKLRNSTKKSLSFLEIFQKFPQRLFQKFFSKYSFRNFQWISSEIPQGNSGICLKIPPYIFHNYVGIPLEKLPNIPIVFSSRYFFQKIVQGIWIPTPFKKKAEISLETFSSKISREILHIFLRKVRIDFFSFSCGIFL